MVLSAPKRMVGDFFRGKSMAIGHGIWDALFFFVGKKHDGETLGFPSTEEISSLGFVHWDFVFCWEKH